MENLEIHSKSFLIKWVNVPDGATMEWQVKPLKKSINFGLFKNPDGPRKGQFNYDEDGDTQSVSSRRGSTLSGSSASSLDKKMEEGGLQRVLWHGKCIADSLSKGHFEVERGNGGMYAMVFDNTFSKTTGKNVLFSLHVTKSSRSRADSKAAVMDSASSAARPTDSNAISDGRALSGPMLKKRRKRLQGYARRYFSLDLETGLLTYYLDQKSSFLRGTMPIQTCVISVKSKTKEIFIDSGMEIWSLKAVSAPDFDLWVKSLKSARRVGSASSAQTRPGSPTQAASDDHWSEITKLVERLETVSNEARAVGPPQTPQEAVGPTETGHSDVVNKLNTLVLDFQYVLATRSKGTQLRGLSSRFASLNASGDYAPRKSMESDSAWSDDEFYDASEGVLYVDDDRDHSEETDNSDVVSVGSSDEDDGDDKGIIADIKRQSRPITQEDLYPLPLENVSRRNTVPKSQGNPPSLVSILRKNVGKDLTTVAMPVTLNEPISILQHLGELLEYSELLDRLAQTEDDVERVMLAAVFSASALSSYRCRERAARKSFNPMLGETYELVREDKGFRMICEKVTHRPVGLALNADSKLWTVQYSGKPNQKFWGKSAELTDPGPIKITINKTGEIFEFIQPSMFMRNIIAGEKYVEPSGTVTVYSSSGTRSTVEYKAGGMFSGRSEELTIRGFSASGSESRTVFQGKWTEQISNASSGEVLWKCGKLIPDANKRYGFTEWIATLNEVTQIEKGHLAPTDSRLRPDLRYYEEGDVANAESMKVEIEESQRARRKERETSGKSWVPLFFEKSDNSDHWVVKKGPESYWARRSSSNWEGLPQLW